MAKAGQMQVGRQIIAREYPFLLELYSRIFHTNDPLENVCFPGIGLAWASWIEGGF